MSYFPLVLLLTVINKGLLKNYELLKLTGTLIYILGIMAISWYCRTTVQRSDSRCSRLKGAEKNNRLNYPCTVSKMKMNVFKAKPLNMCPIFHQLL